MYVISLVVQGLQWDILDGRFWFIHSETAQIVVELRRVVACHCGERPSKEFTIHGEIADILKLHWQTIQSNHECLVLL